MQNFLAKVIGEFSSELTQTKLKEEIPTRKGVSFPTNSAKQTNFEVQSDKEEREGNTSPSAMLRAPPPFVQLLWDPGSGDHHTPGSSL